MKIELYISNRVSEIPTNSGSNFMTHLGDGLYVKDLSSEVLYSWQHDHGDAVSIPFDLIQDVLSSESVFSRSGRKLNQAVTFGRGYRIHGQPRFHCILQSWKLSASDFVNHQITYPVWWKSSLLDYDLVPGFCGIVKSQTHQDQVNT